MPTRYRCGSTGVCKSILTPKPSAPECGSSTPWRPSTAATAGRFAELNRKLTTHTPSESSELINVANVFKHNDALLNREQSGGSGDRPVWIWIAAGALCALAVLSTNGCLS